ncbi:MAG: hypothetical protein ACYTF9_02415 [Planctomycetota bacterium]|jgi:hypothetical protein
MIDKLFVGEAAWYGVPAVVGTLFFLVRLGLMAVGSAGDADAGDFDPDADVDVAGGDHGDSGDAAKALSIQSVATFAMGFGWGGLAALHGFDQPIIVCLTSGLITGALLVWLLGMLLKVVYDLQSSGNVSIQSAQDKEGAVYVRVPGNRDGRGQVRLVINGRQRIFNAVTEGDTIDRGAQVRVMRVNDDNSLTVART